MLGLIFISPALALTTKEFEYKDLHDFNTSSESGFGLNTNLGGSTLNNEQSAHPSGSTTLTLKSTGSESEQTTRATIGGGNITVGGDSNPELAGLNRDVNNTQEITKDIITGALDGSMTVDNRMFSEAGWDSIIDQHEKFFDNLSVAVKDTMNLPNTVIGAVWGAAGIVLGADHYYDEANRVHIFLNNPLGVYGTAGTLGNTINVMKGIKSLNIDVDSYAYREALAKGTAGSLNREDHQVHLLTHELKHRDQGQYLGPLFLPVYLFSGGNSARNWMERQADKVGNDAYKAGVGKGK
jgi:hypothetical protein